MEGSERNLLLSIKIPEAEVAKLLKNAKLVARYVKVIIAAGFAETGCEQSKGSLIQKLCQKDNPQIELIAKYIGNGKISTGEQLDAAIQFTNTTKSFNEQEFEIATGIGIVITDEQITSAVQKVIGDAMPMI